MKTVLLALVLLAPALAHADKNFTGGKGATWDCKTDPSVNINHGKGTYTFTGECKAINVNGGHNTLVIERVESLDINGSSNTITAASVDAINVNGADNKVTWKKSKGAGDKPAVATLGQNNSVSQK